MQIWTVARKRSGWSRSALTASAPLVAAADELAQPGLAHRQDRDLGAGEQPVARPAAHTISRISVIEQWQRVEPRSIPDMLRRDVDARSHARPPSSPRTSRRRVRRRSREELDQLWTVERPRVTQEVADAAALGDRSENADYIYGKRRLREIDRRVRVPRQAARGGRDRQRAAEPTRRACSSAPGSRSRTRTASRGPTGSSAPTSSTSSSG